MIALPSGLAGHRVRPDGAPSLVDGEVRWSARQSLWFAAMSLATVMGCVPLFSWSALLLFAVTTGMVLLFGHSLGSHRKLIHDSFQCPRWLERILVWLGVQVGLAGPLGLLRQHELRDYAQRLPDCHPYLRHGSGFWKDAWWQLHCELRLARPPVIHIEERLASDRFYLFLERTWMWQQLPLAVLFHLWGGWGFVIYGVCARVTAGVFGHWLIGYFAHNHGSMHHEVRGAAVQGHNVRWTSLLTMGECWHNNHHAFPGSARLGLARGEWDPGWWALVALRRVGLAWSLRLPADLAPRSELICLEAAPQVPSAGLLEVVRMILRPAAGAQPEITWPGRTLGVAGLRRLLGPAISLRLDPGVRRMTLSSGRERVLVGLPALCVAAARHRWLGRLAGMLAAPLAVAIECGRSRG